MQPGFRQTLKLRLSPVLGIADDLFLDVARFLRIAARSSRAFANNDSLSLFSCAISALIFRRRHESAIVFSRSLKEFRMGFQANFSG
jgi:hypothetical protein